VIWRFSIFIRLDSLFIFVVFCIEKDCFSFSSM
jgi:hypothetical protein